MGVKVTGQFEPAGAFSIVDGKDVSGHITGSNISGSATGTGSFGKILGDGSDITGIASYTVSNSSGSRILTSLNPTSGNAEANLLFDGSNLSLGTTAKNSTVTLFSTSNTQIQFHDNSSGIGTTDGVRVGWNGTVGQFWVFENAGFRIGTSNLERFTITAGGNVGIGSTNPSYPLDVNGIIASTAAVGVVRLVGTSSGRIYDLKSNSGRFEIRDVDNGQDRLVIGTNGNVGIGNNLLSPGAKLTVDGDISGSLTSTGSFGQVLANDYRSLNNALYVDGSSKYVGIGTNAYTGISATGAWFHDVAGSNGFAKIAVNGSNAALFLNNVGSGELIKGYDNTTVTFTLDQDGSITTSAGADFGGAITSTSNITLAGHLTLNGTNNKISGSATSTGSFGRTEVSSGKVLGKSTSGVTTPFEVVGGTGTSAGGLKFGAYDANFGGIWPASVTPASSNYALVARGARTVINATTDIGLYKNDSTVLLYANSDGVAIGGNSLNPGYKLDVQGTGRFTGTLTTAAITTTGITSTGNISGSATSTGSFGHLRGGVLTSGDGNIKYKAGTQTFQNAAGSKTMAVFNGANSVDLHYNNSKKFETTNTGVTISGNLIATGDITAQRLIVSSSVTNMTIAEKSGSTIFGDSTDDTHLFTGSVNITGSATATSFIGDGSQLTGLTPAAITTYNSAADNRIITSVNSTTVQGESNLTFDGSLFNVVGGVTASAGITAESSVIRAKRGTNYLEFDSNSNGFNYISTPSSKDIRLAPGGGTVMRIQTGKVSIMNANYAGSEALYVQGNIRSNSTSYFGGVEIGNNVLRPESGNDLVISGVGILHVSSSVGKVGIGTTNAAKKLHVQGSAAGIADLMLLDNTQSSNGHGVGILFGLTGVGQGRKGGIFFERTTSNARGSLHFSTHNEGNADSVDITDASLTITREGNIIVPKGNVSGSATSTGSFGRVEASDNMGIGVSSAHGANLTIKGTGASSADHGLRIAGDTGTLIVEGGSESGISVIHGAAGSFWRMMSDGELEFGHRNNFNVGFYTNNTKRMVLNSGGNFSIGNTNNTHKLDVSGTGRFSGTLEVTSGNISGSSTSTGSFGKLFAGGTEVVSSPITALNNATTNELVTIGSTTTELDAQTNLTYTIAGQEARLLVSGVAYPQIRIIGSQLGYLLLGDSGTTSGKQNYQLVSDGGEFKINRTNDAVSSVTATPLKVKDDKVEVLNISGSSTSTGSFGRVNAEHIHSTDDMTVADDLTVDGLIVASGDEIRGSYSLNKLTFPATQRAVINDVFFIHSTSGRGRLQLVGNTNRVGSNTLFGFSRDAVNEFKSDHTSFTYSNFMLEADAVIAFPGSLGASVAQDLSIFKSNVTTTADHGYGKRLFLDFRRDNTAMFTADMSGSIYAFGNVSGSSTSTGSFGSLKATSHQGDLYIQGSSSTAKLKIRPSINTGISELHFSRYNRDNAGYISYNHTADRMDFYAAGPAKRMDMSYSGVNINQALSVGTTITAGGNILSTSGNISGSASSTGSFGSVFSTGNVGIGVLNPTSKLNVSGKTKLSLHGLTASDRLLGLEGHAGQTGDAIQYFKSGGSVLFNVNKDGKLAVGTSATVGQSDAVFYAYGHAHIRSNYQLVFGTNINAASIQGHQSNNTLNFKVNTDHHLRWDSTGLGVNTQSPTHKLHVVGTGKFTDTLTTTAINASGNISGSAISTGSFGRIETAGNLEPKVHNTSNLGSESRRWANIYSADLQLSNMDNEEGNEVDGTKGSWTIQEGEDDLYLLNRKNGKKYKFKLEEIT